MTIELHEEDLVQIEQALDRTKDDIDAEATRAKEEIVAVVGGSWMGEAASRALMKQDDEFDTAKQQLVSEMDDIRTSLGMAREAAAAQEADSVQTISQVVPGTNFHRV